MTSGQGWLARRTADAPEALRRRVVDYLGRREGDVRAGGGDGPAELAARMLAAGDEALDAALARPEDRAVALDLLSADALITLALLARAESAPETLGAFATDALRRASTGA